MIKYWQALAFQLLAFTIRELKHTPAFPEQPLPVKAECTCYCSGEDKLETETKVICYWSLAGSFASGSILATLSCLLYHRRRPAHDSERQIGSPRPRRRGGGVLSGPEGWSESAPMVQG